MSFEQPLLPMIESFLHQHESQGASSKTIKVYRYYLKFWHQWRLEKGYEDVLASITISEIRVFFEYLRDEHVPHQNNSCRPATNQKGLAPHSIDLCYRIIRAFWNFLEIEEVLTDTQKTFFRRGRVPRPKINQSIRATYEREDLQQLLDACHCEDPEKSYRDQSILLLLVETGMRVSELCAMTDETTDLKNHRAWIPGKGGIWRFVYWNKETTQVLTHYLEHRRGKKGGPLLRGVSSRNNGQALIPSSGKEL